MEADKIHSFDDLFTTDHIRILKIFQSYLSPPLQGRLAVMIRFGELLCTVRFYEKNPYAAYSSADTSTTTSAPGPPVFSTDGLFRLMDEIYPFCDVSEREQIHSFQSAFRNIENIRQTMEMFEMLKELMPESFQPDGENKDPQDSPFGFDLSGFSQIMDMMRELNPSP